MAGPVNRPWTRSTLKRKRSGPQRRTGLKRTAGYYSRYSGPAPEKKFLDYQKAETTATGGIVHSNLNFIAQGVGESQRVGRKCCIFNWNIRLGIVMPKKTSADDTESIVRLICGVDHQTNGAELAVTDLLETATYASYRNLAQQERFTIIKDKFFNINATGIANNVAITTPRASRFWKWSKKCSVTLEFNGATGGIMEIKSNSIFMLLIASTTTAETTMFSRVRFGDCLS